MPPFRGRPPSRVRHADQEGEDPAVALDAVLAGVADGARLLHLSSFCRSSSRWSSASGDYNEYSIIPAFTLHNYLAVFDGCISGLPNLCTTFATYLSTLKFCLIVWAVTLVLGFTIAYFLAFHIRTLTMQLVLALVCIIPFWTSDVIRMISWIPLLGRNGLVNKALLGLGLVSQPVEWLLYSEFRRHHRLRPPAHRCS